MFSSKYLTPVKGSNVRTDGVVRKSRWAALAVDSDSDSSPSPSRSPSPSPAARAVPDAPKKLGRAVFQSPALTASPPRSISPPPPVNLAFAADPIMAALARGDILWGDVMYLDPEYRAQEDARIAAALAADAAANQALVERWNASETTLWEQPFARNLEIHLSDHYDMSALTDGEYEDFMRYIYANGFHVEEGGRNYCFASASEEPPRVWSGPDCFAVLAAEEKPAHVHTAGCCSKKAAAPAPLSAPGSDSGRRKGAPVPRFCRAAAACADEGCRYVHGNTIPRVNKPCGFGEGCGASDPSGVKRSQCLFMHPGETWNASLTISRVT